MATTAKAKPPKCFEHPTLECDVVMKGGISSGVVYPGALCSIAPVYRFRNIGGASAGAIAAALLAAAEFRRSVTTEPLTGAGFHRIDQLPRTMGTSVGGVPFLLSLFQPQPETRALFDTVMEFLRGFGRGLVMLVRRFWHFPLLAAVVALGSVCLSWRAGADWAFAVAGVLVAPWVLLVGTGVELIRALQKLAQNDFGMCRLGEQPEFGGPALTKWLADEIQLTAGRPAGGRPLTFADLWGAPSLPAGKPTPEALERHRRATMAFNDDPHTRQVDLQMMTTNLTQGRPMRLPEPFEHRTDVLEDEAGHLLYRPKEFAQFFPPEVMAHLKHVSKAPGPRTTAILGEDAGKFKRFPAGPDLPVVVAARMSLSFPILISALPLWTIEYRRKPQSARLRKLVLSDGGITSNFPVHFFDAPLPTRPTFGINLAGFDADEHPNRNDPRTAVRDPGQVNRPTGGGFAEARTVFEFLVTIKDAMQNWRDNAQARLPGFRERIIHIKLDRGEGGLNFAMPPEKIEELTARGECAGDRLVELFNCRDGIGNENPPNPSACRWNDHRFARYRTAMAQLDRYLRRFAYGYATTPDDGITIPYAERVVMGATVNPYRLTLGDLAFAQQTTTTYTNLVKDWKYLELTMDGKGVPRPPSDLRATPQG